MVDEQELLKHVQAHISYGIPLACFVVNAEDEDALFQYGIRHLEILQPVIMTLVFLRPDMSMYLWENEKKPYILLFTEDMKTQGDFFVLSEKKQDWYAPFLLTTIKRQNLPNNVLRLMEGK